MRLRHDGARSEVHVVASTTRPLPQTAAEVHRAVAPLVPGGVDVVVGDVAAPDEQAETEL